MCMDYTRANPSPRYRDLIAQYRTMHTEGERFLDTYRRIGLAPFKSRVYASNNKAA